LSKSMWFVQSCLYCKIIEVWNLNCYKIRKRKKKKKIILLLFFQLLHGSNTIFSICLPKLLNNKHTVH
jgi:hypothetical protein